jgi:hypothetical protein
MPKFEEFSRDDARASHEGAMFTLQARGLISFNHAAFTALGEPDSVALLYDTAENIVAMRSVPKSHENAYTVRKQQHAHSYLVGAQGFVAHYQIPTQRALRFPGHDYGDGVWGFALREGTVVQNRRGRQPRPPATERWRHTSDGVEVPELMRITHVGMSHPGYMQRPPGAKPPTVRVGTLVACSPLGSQPATSELRSRFLSFLSWAPVMGLISPMSHIDPGTSWTAWAGRGRFNFEAVLTDGNEDKAPAASALLLLPEEGKSQYGRDARLAELVLDIELRNPDGGQPSPVNLAAWHDRFTRVLQLPAELVRFLAEDLNLTASDDPPAQAGVWLTASASIQEMVDVETLRTLKGTMPSPQFIGWALADPGGDTAEGAAAGWLTEMCDNTLHLDGYEAALERIRAGQKDELRIGQRLTAGQPLHSSDGRFRFEVGEDADLIVHWIGHRAIWNSDTAKARGEYYLILQEDGNLVLYDADDKPIWSADTVGSGAESLVMQSDGNLVLHSNKGAVWASGVVISQP